MCSNEDAGLGTVHESPQQLTTRRLESRNLNYYPPPYEEQSDAEEPFGTSMEAEAEEDEQAHADLGEGYGHGLGTALWALSNPPTTSRRDRRAGRNSPCEHGI